MTMAAVLVVSLVALGGIKESGAADTPLRTLADQQGIVMGAAAVAQLVTSSGCTQEPMYCQTLGTEYNMIVPENAMKFEVIHPQQDVYDFSQADAIVSFAQAHNMKVRGHTLVWAQQVPAWVTNGGFTPQQLQSILQDHITTVISHFRDTFPGVVVEWDVVNEGQDLGIWGQIGTLDQVATLAFTWARQVDPTVKLYYNDYSIEDFSGTKANWAYAFLINLKNRGVPIDGVGFESHFELPGYSLSELEANLRRYADAGLEVKYTELDARIRKNTTTNLNTQAELYGRVVTACLDVPLACKGVVTWGFTDKYSWIPSAFPGYGYALPFDANYAPKPAYFAMQNALTGTSTSPTPTPNPDKFTIGDRVQTTGSLQVRQSPGTNARKNKVLGTQPFSAQGTVISGPTVADGYTWYNIDYDTGVDGWSVQDYLTKIAVTDATQPLGHEMTAQLASMGGVLQTMQSLLSTPASLSSSTLAFIASTIHQLQGLLAQIIAAR